MNSTNVTDGSLCLLEKVLIGAVLTVLIVVTVCGNVMVCLAVYLNRRLRSRTNCFIVSLAFTDLLLGLLVLPFSAVYEISSHEWLLNVTFCNVYVSLDVMLCTASILNLFVISLDRYYAITAPLRYSTVVTPLRVIVALILIWVVSLMVSFLPISLGWNTKDMTIQNQIQMNGKQECKLEVNASYVLVDGLLTFYFPLIIMCTTYYRIFKIAREQAKRINHSTCCKTDKTILPTVKEHKATVTLAAVMGAFIVCWFPYFTVFTYRGVMGAVCDRLMTVVLWLGYANSALNPILYAALNRDFRTAYQRLLKCRRIRPDTRETSLSHEMRDKSCHLMTNLYENKHLETHTMNGKAKPLIKETIKRQASKSGHCDITLPKSTENRRTQFRFSSGENLESVRNQNPPCDISSSTILPICQSLWLAKVLPKKNIWIPVFEQSIASEQNIEQHSATHTVIYCVFS